MHVLATKHELCNLSDSAYELNALFAFKTGILLCKDEQWNHDENFKLKFFFS